MELIISEVAKFENCLGALRSARRSGVDPLSSLEDRHLKRRLKPAKLRETGLSGRRR